MKKKVFLGGIFFLIIATILAIVHSQQKQEIESRAAGNETQMNVYTTAYTYWDNTPPGSADISHPIIHQKAGGTGTYEDPITIAVGHSIINGEDILDYPAGTRFYIPNVRRYFIVEDTCGDGNTPQNGPCHTGYPSGASAWLDMWIDGQSASASESDNCANAITDVFLVIRDPNPNYAVVQGPVINNGSCTQQYGNTIVTTGTPTNTPTEPLSPTNTPGVNSTRLMLNLFLHGIGKGGDSANPEGTGNENPEHPQRGITLDLYNQQNMLVATIQGIVTFSSSTGNFTGEIVSNTNIPSGIYTIKVKTDRYLRSLIPGIQTLISGQVNILPTTTLIAGDINGDNVLNILDYGILLDCYSDILSSTNCSTENKLLSDLNDDNAVNQFDYNLFLRELVNRHGV